MQERSEQQTLEGLEKIGLGCGQQRRTVGEIERRVGRLLRTNPRAARLFKVRVEQDAAGYAQPVW